MTNSPKSFDDAYASYSEAVQLYGQHHPTTTGRLNKCFGTLTERLLPKLELPSDSMDTRPQGSIVEPRATLVGAQGNIQQSPSARLGPQPLDGLSSAELKLTPVCRGFLWYFPKAVAAVARHSQKANDKHNLGQPLHWSKHQSKDHADALMRHQMNPDSFDPEFGELHAVAVAWRAMAQLETIIEDRQARGLPVEL